MRIILYVNKFAIFGLEGESSFEARASDRAGLCPIVVGLDRWQISFLKTGAIRATKRPRFFGTDLEILLWVDENGINRLTNGARTVVGSIKISEPQVGSLSYCQLGFSLRQWRLSWHAAHQGKNTLVLTR